MPKSLEERGLLDLRHEQTAGSMLLKGHVHLYVVLDGDKTDWKVEQLAGEYGICPRPRECHDALELVSGAVTISNLTWAAIKGEEILLTLNPPFKPEILLEQASSDQVFVGCFRNLTGDSDFYGQAFSLLLARDRYAIQHILSTTIRSRDARTYPLADAFAVWHGQVVWRHHDLADFEWPKYENEKATVS